MHSRLENQNIAHMGVIWSVLVSHFPFFVSQLSPVLFRLFLTWRRSPFALCQNFQPYTVEAPKAPRTTKWFLVCSYYQCWVENQLQLEKLHLPKWMPETSLTLTFCYCTPKKYIVPAFSDVLVALVSHFSWPRTLGWGFRNTQKSSGVPSFSKHRNLIVSLREAPSFLKWGWV